MIPERAIGMRRDDWIDDWWNDDMAEFYRECEGCHRMWPIEDLTKELDRYWCQEDSCQETLAEDKKAVEWEIWRDKHMRPGIDF
jgi:hypothetical protein